MKYWAVYKCQLCGKLYKIGDSIEVPYDKLPELLGKVVQNQLFAGNPYLHKAQMYIPCKCDNGDAGLAQFVGFVQDNNKDKDVTNFLNKLIHPGL